MAGNDHGGGIFGLLDLIEEHKSALRYDWRNRFAVGFDESVPGVIGWEEALDLVRVLRSDPSSQLAASLEGWDYPLSRVGWMLADLIDVQGQTAAGKKWKAYPRPTKPRGRGDRDRIVGNVAGMTYAETVARLRALGHNLPASA